MFDIAWSEMAVIAGVALVVIGPKELPRVLRQVGIWTRKLRMMAGEFQRNLDDMVREADLDDVKRQIERVGQTDLKREIERTIDPTGSVERSLRLDDGPELSRIPSAEPSESVLPPPAAAPDQPDGSKP